MDVNHFPADIQNTGMNPLILNELVKVANGEQDTVDILIPIFYLEELSQDSGFSGYVPDAVDSINFNDFNDFADDFDEIGKWLYDQDDFDYESEEYFHHPESPGGYTETNSFILDYLHLLTQHIEEPVLPFEVFEDEEALDNWYANREPSEFLTTDIPEFYLPEISSSYTVETLDFGPDSEWGDTIDWGLVDSFRFGELDRMGGSIDPDRITVFSQIFGNAEDAEEVLIELLAAFEDYELFLDHDGDGNINILDADYSANLGETDTDGDNIIDAFDPDIDNDGVSNYWDDFPYDDDEWRDLDLDGTGDNADTDDDGDGVADVDDFDHPDNQSESNSDLDGDGIADHKDNDIDGDGVSNTDDFDPYDPFEWQDEDIDGIGDNRDLDDDNDGIADYADKDHPSNAAPESGTDPRPDSDGDGIIDLFDSHPNTPNSFNDRSNDGIADIFQNPDGSIREDTFATGDDDEDGIPNFADADHAENFNYSDSDIDGIIDGFDIDFGDLNTLFSDTDLIQDFIIDELNEYWKLSTQRNIQSTIDLINILLRNRSHLGGGDIKNLPNLVDMEFLDSTFQGADSDKFLKLMLEFNMIGDGDNEEQIEFYITEILASGVDIQAGGPGEDYPEHDSETDETAATYASLLDQLLNIDTNTGRDHGEKRGHLSRGEIAGDREESFNNAGLDIGVEEINYRVLSSYNAELHGIFTDTGTDDERVDLTIFSSGRDTTLAHVDVDMTIDGVTTTKKQGHFKIINEGAPDVTDAYVIASADELYLRDEWTADSHAESYSDPEPYQIDVENASLGLASIDTMHLINVDITTQGSLAIATLDDLNLRSTRPEDDNVFNVGHEGVRNEGLFLYASNELSIRDLTIQGKIDDIYMEATTISLQNVVFPHSATVKLRSELGGIVFNGYEPGRVNMNNVKHLGISTTEYLQLKHFDSSNRSKKLSSTGRPLVQVEAWGSGH